MSKRNSRDRKRARRAQRAREATIRSEQALDAPTRSDGIEVVVAEAGDPAALEWARRNGARIIDVSR